MIDEIKIKKRLFLIIHIDDDLVVLNSSFPFCPIGSCKTFVLIPNGGSSRIGTAGEPSEQNHDLQHYDQKQCGNGEILAGYLEKRTGNVGIILLRITFIGLIFCVF